MAGSNEKINDEDDSQMCKLSLGYKKNSKNHCDICTTLIYKLSCTLDATDLHYFSLHKSI